MTVEDSVLEEPDGPASLWEQKAFRSVCLMPSAQIHYLGNIYTLIKISVQ